MRIAAPIELSPDTRPDAARIEHVSRQLEGQFAQLLVKSMRDASFGDSLFPGENQLFRDLYDQQLAKALTQGKGLGIAPMIARQLGSDAQPAAPLDTRLDPVRGKTDGLAALPADGSAQALDLIAGREASAGAGQQAARSPMDDFIARLIERAPPAVRSAVETVGAVAAKGAAVVDAAARAAAEGFAPKSPERFVASIWSHAQEAARELGVDARALVAQAALETGWGRRMIQRGDGGSAHNLFGIKATGWKGERATATTHEYSNGVKHNERADFRAYASAAESFADYVRLLKTSPRYRQALQAGTDVRGFAQGLQRAGYATDPSYAAKINAIATGPTVGRAVAAIAAASRGIEGADRAYAAAAAIGGTAIRR